MPLELAEQPGLSVMTLILAAANLTTVVTNACEHLPAAAIQYSKDATA